MLSANPKFACTGERVIQKTPLIWAGGNSTRLFTNPFTASPLAFTASLPKQKHSRTKSRQLRRLAPFHLGPGAILLFSQPSISPVRFSSVRFLRLLMNLITNAVTRINFVTSLNRPMSIIWSTFGLNLSQAVVIRGCVTSGTFLTASCKICSSFTYSDWEVSDHSFSDLYKKLGPFHHALLEESSFADSQRRI